MPSTSTQVVLDQHTSACTSYWVRQGAPLPRSTATLTLKSSFLIRPFRKSLTNCVFSARSWDSLVPSFSSSERSVGLQASRESSFHSTSRHSKQLGPAAFGGSLHPRQPRAAILGVPQPTPGCNWHDLEVTGAAARLPLASQTCQRERPDPYQKLRPRMPKQLPRIPRCLHCYFCFSPL